MSLTNHMLESFIKLTPKIGKLAARIEASHNLIVNYPLELRNNRSGNALVSIQKVKKGNDLLVMAASQCLFSSGMIGASQTQEQMIENKLQELSKKYESINQDFIDRLKIYLQVYINSLNVVSSSNLPQKGFAQYILEQNLGTINKNDINSRFLHDLYQSIDYSNRMTFSFMHQDLLKRVQEQDYLKICEKTKPFIRNIPNSTFKFAAPFIDRFYHSFNPSCQFDILHFPHRKAPFVRIRTLRDIEAGERPTLNYGPFNNYELLLKYGFTVPNNANNVFMLPISFDSIMQIFGKNIEWKQQQFKRRNLKLKNYVRITRQGHLHPTDLQLLRIVFNDSHKPVSTDTDKQTWDPLLYKLIGGYANNLRKNIKINNLKKSNPNRNLQNLQEEEVCILDAYLHNHPL